MKFFSLSISVCGVAASIVASYSNNAHTFAFLLLQESRQDKTEATEEPSRPATLTPQCRYKLIEKIKEGPKGLDKI